jgi:hypothetical protein
MQGSCLCCLAWAHRPFLVSKSAFAYLSIQGCHVQYRKLLHLWRREMYTRESHNISGNFHSGTEMQLREIYLRVVNHDPDRVTIIQRDLPHALLQVGLHHLTFYRCYATRVVNLSAVEDRSWFG